MHKMALSLNELCRLPPRPPAVSEHVQRLIDCGLSKAIGGEALATRGAESLALPRMRSLASQHEQVVVVARKSALCQEAMAECGSNFRSPLRRAVALCQ